MVTKNPDYNVYTVGWICIVSSEMNAARALLDEEHESLPPKPMDDNSYLLGRMNGHNVVIGDPGSGLYGPHNASHVATNMARTFPNIRFGLLVGVGGGAPGTADAENTWNNIRLGDVVVSNPKGSHGGVLHYDARANSKIMDLNYIVLKWSDDVIVSRALDKVDLGLSQLTTSVEKVSIILEWLHPHNFCAEQSETLSQCQEGTRQWFLDSPMFQEWLNHDNEALLCQGFPGAGKTVISSIIMNHLITQYQDNDDVNITYLYCSFRRQHEQKPADLFAILLKQAALRMETLPACVLKLCKNWLIRRGTRSSCSQILRALATVLTACRRSFIVIDALDEHVICHEDHADFLEGVFELKRQANVNIIATSRYMAEIEDEFKRQNGRFLDILATNEDDKTTLSGLQHALQGHPKGSEAYDRVYSEALERITGQMTGFKDLAMRALEELQYALAIEHDSKEFDQDNCTSLITVDEASNTIHLVHSTWRI
ncbi:hypothetical protein BDV30DRAFT_222969 [Aspergillus minisclerotigenes]|uniref:Nephrocystin 3-like N-terminal domain-containing protein n=1 Tax=Aspergillus minisclerotigenes TaxID=656917 RepID=A0A5N6JHN7_9EURO|nr:hypothetical protein BDV30DRAFT_222969 [Aspergillus minisclerotigenes]